MKYLTPFIILIVTIYMSLNVVAAPVIKVIGLFKDKALVVIDGKNKILHKGQSYKDFILEYADSKRAVISYNGVSAKYTMGTIGGGLQFKKAKSSTYHISANPQGMFYTQGSINGKPMRFIVDTGATMVSMNNKHATSIGIDVKRDGQAINVKTASEIVKGYKVKLKSVKVGEIQFHDIDATILMSNQPETILLGMSFLKNIRVSHSGNVMTLEKN